MEYHEKLQALRKQRGLTQEQLAEALFVSRTTISKWESGRGYPSIDSLKEISNYFSISIDELLSGDQLITIAEKENKSNLNRIYDRLIGFVDCCSLMLIFLPLYPKPVNGYIYSVNLFTYTGLSEPSAFSMIYWGIYLSLTTLGLIKIGLNHFQANKGIEGTSILSVSVSILAILLFAMAREAYATVIVFLLFLIKVTLLFKQVQLSN